MGLTATPVRALGLTGGIGSGKSAVARVLVACGATLVDTDAIARALTLPGGAAIDALRTAFGDAMITPDGALDRDKMRALAFAEPSARQRLESILHPMIGDEARRQAAASTGVVVYDVPLLAAASRWRREVDRLIVVDCKEDTQCRRVMQRSGWTEAAVRSVIAQQAARADRRRLADAVLHNDGISLEQLSDHVHALWRHWCGPS